MASRRRFRASVILCCVYLLGINAKFSAVLGGVGRSMMGSFSMLVSAENFSSNPIYWGFHDSTNFSIHFLGISSYWGNNSFNLRDYLHYNGAYLKENDKKNILQQIPAVGLIFNSQLAVQPISVHYGPVAFSTSVIASAEGVVAEDIFSLLLFGNQVGYEYHFRPAKAEAIFFTGYSLSGAHTFRFSNFYLPRLTVCLKGNYLRGHFYAQTKKMQARALTEFTSIRADGQAYLRYAKGGDGFSFDWGMVGEISDHWRTFFMMEHLGAQVRWSRQPKMMYTTFILDGTNIDEILQTDRQWDEVVVHSDSSYHIHPFTSRIPLVLRLAGQYQRGRFAAWGEYGIGLRESALTTNRGRLALGGEYRPWRFLPLRLGLALGGKTKFMFSYGFGLRIGAFAYDLALQQIGGILPTQLRGIGLVSGFSLNF